MSFTDKIQQIIIFVIIIAVGIYIITLQGDMNNNKMERLNGEFRDRKKVVKLDMRCAWLVVDLLV